MTSLRILGVLPLTFLSLSTPSALARAPTTLYSFACQSDGAYPQAGLIYLQGELFGTTYEGGSNNFGTIFEVDANSGVETILHSFGATSGDGFNPSAGLIYRTGSLYGTTAQGGDHQNGTLFVFNPTTGSESIVYAFAGGSDGAMPTAPLIQSGEWFYGTTLAGGATGAGTVFSFNLASKTEMILHSFGASGDGATPYAPVLKVDGNLYGTTFSGGGPSYTGTVFKLNIATHAETVLSTFDDGQSGLSPVGGLTVSAGSLYGTTSGGGGGTGGGEVYSIDPVTGALKIVYEFGGAPDGSSPMAGLVGVKNALYGTTVSGGQKGGSSGTLFKYTPNKSKEAVVADFAGGANGAQPVAGLIYENGYLYGTTQYGGTYNCGTVFSLKP